MERFFEITKLTAIAVAIVVAILCLGYSNAYGITAPQFTKPGGESLLPQGPVSATVTVQFDDVDVDFGGGNGSGDKAACPPVPEPATLILLGVGLVGIRLLKRRN